MNLNGVLVVDKPAGPTSHDVVASVRRALGEKRVGHTGTLDPLATGVLALLVGRATRLSQFLVNDEKEYLADVRLGIATATYDAEGLEGLPLTPEATQDPRHVAAVLERFRGTYLQMPPPYSAKKVAGTRAYERARKNQPIELKPVEVTVAALEALPSDDPGLLRLRVACTSGFYVRTLAHEVGRALGCGAHLERLRRTRSGDFSIDQAVPLGDVLANPQLVWERGVPMGRLLGQVPSVVLNERGIRRVLNGNAAGPQDFENSAFSAGFPARVRLLDPRGELLAVAEARADGLLHPAVVLG